MMHLRARPSLLLEIFVPELIYAAIGMSGDICGNIVCVYDGEHKRETSIFDGCSHALVALKTFLISISYGSGLINKDSS